MFHIIGDFNITGIVQETPVLTFEKEHYSRKNVGQIYIKIFLSQIFMKLGMYFFM